jgi:hypothetical protein
MAVITEDDSPGVLSRIEVVEPPIHAAVVDAGEHDESAGRFKDGGHRKQQRHGHGRADAGQDADGGAQETPIRAYSRFMGVSAVANPSMSEDRTSI